MNESLVLLPSAATPATTKYIESIRNVDLLYHEVTFASLVEGAIAQTRGSGGQWFQFNN